jgi:hypothetical protein
MYKKDPSPLATYKTPKLASNQSAIFEPAAMQHMPCQLSRSDKKILLRADMKFFALIAVLMASVAVATPDPALQAEIAANKARGVCGPMPPVS